MKPKRKYLMIGAILTVFLILVMGVPTAMVPNPLFKRMIDVTILDYLFLFGVSILLGAFISIGLYKRNSAGKEDYIAGGGGILGIFAFACPLCNAVLLSVFGSTFVASFFLPFKPWIGLISLAILSFAVLQKLKCKRCKR